jgi:hypothetical protein
MVYNSFYRISTHCIGQNVYTDIFLEQVVRYFCISCTRRQLENIINKTKEGYIDIYLRRFHSCMYIFVDGKQYATLIIEYVPATVSHPNLHNVVIVKL